MAKKKDNSAELSNFLAALERAFDTINKELFESVLSKKPVITIAPTPGAYGHFTPYDSWKDADGNARYEINLGANTIDRPAIETIATLVHEMVHLYCHENDLKDTSRGGTYHNKVFKREAERRGLKIGYDSRIGYSLTSPGEALLELEKRGAFKDVANTLHRVAGSRRTSPTGKKSSSTRKYVCPSCGMSVRATKEVNILCIDCDEQLTTGGATSAGDSDA